MSRCVVTLLSAIIMLAVNEVVFAPVRGTPLAAAEAVEDAAQTHRQLAAKMYVATDEPSNACADGYRQIDSLDECKAACAARGLPFDAEGSWPDFPGGCFEEPGAHCHMTAHGTSTG